MGQFVFFLSILSLFAASYLVWATYEFFSEEFPNVGMLRSRYPVVQYQGRDKPAKVSLQRSRPMGWVSIREVSRAAVGAVIVSEDWAFYQHKGYDANQIRESIKEDLEQGRFARGASTITQQVVRNVFLEKDKNLWRKLKELYLAVRLEQQVGKSRILEVYLNIAEWGEGIYGINAAARHYFRKSPGELTAKEGAFLAMLLPSPKRYSQSFYSRRLTDYARSTINSILSKMEQARYLSEEDRYQQSNIPLPFESSSESELPSPSAL